MGLTESGFWSNTTSVNAITATRIAWKPFDGMRWNNGLITAASGLRHRLGRL
ncbi:MAG: hypothetical protein AB8B86_14960 [Pseudomonadales bacterium]